jgi:hypothetical protein
MARPGCGTLALHVPRRANSRYAGHDVWSYATAGGWIDWSVDQTGWVVTLYLPREQNFTGPMLEDGLTACLT